MEPFKKNQGKIFTILLQRRGADRILAEPGNRDLCTTRDR